MGNLQRFLLLHFAGLLLSTSLAAASDAAVSPLVVESIGADAPGESPFQVGDRLLAYDEKPLPSPASLQAVSENTFGKRAVIVRLQRSGEILEVPVLPGSIGLEVRPELPADVLRLYESGVTAHKAQRAGEQIKRWEEAAQAAGREGSVTAAAWLYEKVAEANENQGKWEEAATAHLAAQGLLKGGKDPAAESRALVGLGRCSQRLNDYPAAQRWFEQARDVDAAAVYELWVTADLISLGNVFRAKGELQLARENYTQALAVRERLLPNSREVAASLNNLGVIAGMSGDLPLAEDYFHRSLVIREQLAPGSLEVTDSLNNLAIVARARGDLSAARDHHTRALAIRERLLPNSVLLATSLDNLGLVALDQGDLQAAHSYHSRALAIFERLAPGSPDVAASYNNLGLVARARGDLQAAKQYHSRDLAITQKLAPDSLDLAMSLNNMGLVSQDLGDLKAAESYHSRALALFERLAPDTLKVADALGNMGLVAMARGRMDLAQDFFSRGQAIQERLAPETLPAAYTLDNLGEIARQRGNLQAARDLHLRASAIFERLSPNSLNLARNLSLLGEMALASQQFSEAQTLFARAITIVESQRGGIYTAKGRALLVAQHTKPYEGLMRADVALGDVSSAFVVSERARARSLLDLLAEAHTDLHEGMDPSLLQKERSLQRLLNGKAKLQTDLLSEKHSAEQASAVAKEIEAITLEYDRVQAEIRASSPRYAALTRPHPLSLEEIQREVLDRDTVLLEYSLGEDASQLFVVSQSDIKNFSLPKRSEVELAARQVYDCLSARNQRKPGETASQRQARIAKADARYPQAARRLSQMLIAPARALLNAPRLLIVAGGALLYIPFGALPDPSARQYQPLVMSYEIATAPSASVLALQRRETLHRPAAPRELAIFADPVFERDDPRVRHTHSSQSRGVRPLAKLESLKATDAARPQPETTVLRDAVREAGAAEGNRIRRLAFSREEGETIYALAAANASFKALDFAANRNAVISPELSQYRIVHFATHALVNNQHPELSGIVLSLVEKNGRPVDGFLRLNEIYGLNLPAELVVLSACQTALGKEIKGEGLIGLTRGFMYAGASRVVASLWKVDDEATAVFMKFFYGEMLKGGQPAGSSLREAQMAMSRQTRWRAPYFWAAFELQGEWK